MAACNKPSQVAQCESRATTNLFSGEDPSILSHHHDCKDPIDLGTETEYFAAHHPIGLWDFMPCLLLILVLAFPRIALLLLFLFSTYLERAYHGLLLPLLGFIFLPLTTLAYAWMMNTGQSTAGINLLILLVAVVIDLGGLGGGEYHRRRNY
jgi:hypothetical protein